MYKIYIDGLSTPEEYSTVEDAKHDANDVFGTVLTFTDKNGTLVAKFEDIEIEIEKE